MVLRQRLIEVDFGLCAWLYEQLALRVTEGSITLGTRSCQRTGGAGGDTGHEPVQACANLLSSDRIVVLDEFRGVRYLLLRKRHSDMCRTLHLGVRPSQAGERVGKKKFATVGAWVWRMCLGDGRDGERRLGVKRGRQN